MTIAICIRCGAQKLGALTPCLGCLFDPTSNEDKAKSMVLSDHFLSIEDLHALGERIRTGQAVGYPQEVIADYMERFEQGADRFRLLPAHIGCLIVLAIATVGIYLAFRAS